MNCPLPLRPLSAASIEDGAADVSLWLTEEDYELYSIHRHVTKTIADITKSKKRKADVMVAPAARAVVTESAASAAPTSGLDEIMHARKTVLLKSDHESYLALHAKKLAAQKQGMPEIIALSESEHAEFRRLDGLVARELRRECDAAKELYPRTFNSISRAEMVLEPQKVFEGVAPKHRKAVFATGASPVATSVPALAPRWKVPEEIIQETLTAPWTSTAAPSADTVMQSLMKAHKCAVAIADAALAVLFDNHRGRYRQAWTIPVVVNDRREVYMDAPLVHAKWSGRQMLSAFCGRLLPRILTQAPTTPTTLDGMNYNIWELDTLSLLVRTARVAKTIQAKIDYEWGSHPEQLSESERAQYWLQAWLCGHTGLVLGRFNTAELIELTQESLSSIVSPDENPLAKFQLVQTLLGQVLELPTGRYVVSHANHIVTMYQEDPDGGGAFDLHRWLDAAGTLDPSILGAVLPQWHLPTQIPYSFHVATFCKSYAFDNACDRLSRRKPCSHVHVRPGKRDSVFVVQMTTGMNFKKERRVPLPKVFANVRLCKAFLDQGCFEGTACRFEHVAMATILQTIVDDVVASAARDAAAQRQQQHARHNHSTHNA
ncbi:Aste57867_25220 [Aphanomyces stellatus]|uniref:Aste57867_25220 protein n=1 Tax=Aphanomyces stellatus TaxID=120398 RepID=A0A485LSL4_9STRA|nr:hypothetical protein As57867_025142 [Aphanomyces stellatus]VFU01847.1 Aste57867_25220 [Aphanomyces stellatus]